LKVYDKLISKRVTLQEALIYMTETTLNKILVVEDEADIRKILQMSLEKIGHFIVKACASGEEALQVAEEFAPDLILLDVMMPVMDGFETMKRLREKLTLANTPIIFVTAKNEPTDIAHYRNLGAMDVISKPFNPTTITELLRVIWKERQTSKDELKTNLDKLQNQYQEKLPLKIDELHQAWEQLKLSWDKDAINKFFRIIHNFSETSEIYGHQKLTAQLNKLQDAIHSLQPGSQVTDQDKSLIESLFLQIKNIALEPYSAIVISTLEKRHQAVLKTIYIFDANETWAKSLATQLSLYGYEVKTFILLRSLVELKDISDSSALIINVSLLDESLKAHIDKMTHRGIPIIYTSEGSEFNLRLRAVQNGGNKYFVKPFAVEELVIQLNNIYDTENAVYNILIIESEEDVASYFELLFRQAGMVAYILNDISKLDNVLHEFKPDVILTNVFLKECEGVELASIIHQQSFYENIPIIILSSEETIEQKINILRSGASHYISQSTNPDLLIAFIKNMAYRYKRLSMSELKDNLTGVLTQSHMVKLLDTRFKAAIRTQTSLSVGLIDLDNINKINSSFGHAAGDHVLKSLCLMLSNRLRPTDVIGRYGDHKIMIVLPNTMISSAQTLLEEMQAKFVGINYQWQNQIYNSSFSAGLASAEKFQSIADLLHAINESLEKTKKNSANKLTVV
jgi:diguanylate cyclase (GGDEF)-like protein